MVTISEELRIVREQRENEANAWLSTLLEEIPVFANGEVIRAALNIHYIVFDKALDELKKAWKKGDWRNEYMWQARVDRLARFLDYNDPDLQKGRYMSREEETANAFGQMADIHTIALEGLDRGQKFAIEAGLSGQEVPADFKQALNDLWMRTRTWQVAGNE